MASVLDPAGANAISSTVADTVAGAVPAATPTTPTGTTINADGTTTPATTTGSGLINTLTGSVTTTPPVAGSQGYTAVDNTPVQGYTPATVAPIAGYTPAVATATGYDVTKAGSQGYGATNWNVDPATQTTSGQLKDVLDPNNPLMVQAAGLGTAQANARGLVNSTMGITAADAAMYGVAVPIASSNAGTYASAAQTNAGAANAAAQFTAGAANTAELQNAGAANAQGQFKAGALNVAGLTNAGALNTEMGQTQSLTAQQSLTDAQAKNAALSQTQSLTAQSNLSNQQAENMSLSQTAAAANAASLANVQAATSIANNISSNAASLTQTQLQTQSQQAIQLLQSQYQSIIQGNAQATSIVNQVLANITNIQNSTTMDQAAKNTAVSQQLGLLTQGLQTVQASVTATQSTLGSLDLGKIFGADTVDTSTGGTGLISAGGTPIGTNTPATTPAAAASTDYGGHGAPSSATTATNPRDGLGNAKYNPDGSLNSSYTGGGG